MASDDMDILIDAVTGLGNMKDSLNGGALEYLVGDHCLECLKDLQRLLRKGDLEISATLGEWNVVKSNLVPLLLFNKGDETIILNTVKVIVFLTMPPPNPDSELNAASREYLQNYKAAFLETDSIATIVTLLESPLENAESDNATDEDWKLIQLVLTLFRNLLAIPDPLPQENLASGGYHMTYLKEDMIARFAEEGVLDFILAMTEQVNGTLRSDKFLLLELCYLILNGEAPEKLLLNGMKIKSNKKPVRQDEMARFVLNAQKQTPIRLQNGLGRHSLFSGSFVLRDSIKTMGVTKLGSSNEQFCDNLSRVAPKRKKKNQPVATPVPFLPSRHLKKASKEISDFVHQFFESCYGVLADAAFDSVRSGNCDVQREELAMFFKIAAFFVSYQFHRLQNKEVNKLQQRKESLTLGDSELMYSIGADGPLGLTLSEEMADLAVCPEDTFILGYSLNIVEERMSFLNEMAQLVDYKLKKTDSSTEFERGETRAAKMILHHLFYNQTSNGIFPLLNRCVVLENRRVRLLAISSAHVFLRLFENVLKDEGGKFKVKTMDLRKQSDIRRDSMKSLVNLNSAIQALGMEGISGDEDEEDEDFHENEENEGEGFDEESEFDFEPEEYVAEQKSMAVASGVPTLKEHQENVEQVERGSGSESDVEAEENAGKQKAVVEPADGEAKGCALEKPLTMEGDIHGPENIEIASDENHVLVGQNLESKEEMRASTSDQSLGKSAEKCEDNLEDTGVQDDGNCSENNPDLSSTPKSSTIDDKGDSETSRGENSSVVEDFFTLTDVTHTFARNSSVVMSYCEALDGYNENSVQVNYYIVRMLQRTTEMENMEIMLFQVSALTTFYKILSDPKLQKDKESRFMVDFATKIVQEFLEMLKQKPFLFIEALFWKNVSDCVEISNNYASVDKTTTGRRRKMAAVAEMDDDNDEDSDDSEWGSKGRDLKGKENVNKREKKKLLEITEEHAKKIKELYETYKTKRSMARLIAEELEPRGAFTTRQVSKHLKAMALEWQPNRRIRDKIMEMSSESENEGPVTADNGNQIAVGEKQPAENTSDFYDKSHPKTARKPKATFTEADDLELQSLYSLYGSQRNCVSKIASEFKESKLSASQISRRLAKLGLKTPRVRKSTKSDSFLAEISSESSGEEREEAEREIIEGNFGGKLSLSEGNCIQENDDSVVRVQDQKMVEETMEQEEILDLRIIQRKIRELCESDGKEAVKWVYLNLKQAAFAWNIDCNAIPDPFPNCFNYSMALVTDEDWNFIENKTVCGLLLVLGMKPPSEGFFNWRIMGDTAETMVKVVKFLEGFLLGSVGHNTAENEKDLETKRGDKRSQDSSNRGNELESQGVLLKRRRLRKSQTEVVADGAADVELGFAMDFDD